MLVAAHYVGAVLVMLGLCSFLLNIFMIYVFVSKKLISIKHENHTIYRLILNFLVNDTIQVTPTIYIAICATLQEDLLGDEFGLIPGTINLWTWYQMMLMLKTMALNRYVGICHFNKYASIFTARTAAILIVGTWLFSGALAISSQFIASCCAMIPFYPIFTFMYRNPLQKENIVDKYNFCSEICCVILLFCYARILWRVHKSSREALSTTTRSVQRHRIRQNIRFAIQFLFISLFFVLMYIFYTFFPRLLPGHVLLPYSAIAFCMVAHCTINSIMYLTFNPEVRRLALYTLWGKYNNDAGSQHLQRSHFSATAHQRSAAWETTAH